MSPKRSTLLDDNISQQTNEESSSASEQEDEEETITVPEKPKTKNPNSKPKSPATKKKTALRTPEKTKRPSAESDVKGKKKAKLAPGDLDNEKKRIWSDEEEILILQRFVDYRSMTGCSPLSDMDGFHAFTMELLQENASKSKLYEKIRRLKKMFLSKPLFRGPHERALYEVSKKIWEPNGCEIGSDPKPETEKIVEVEDEEFETLYKYWNAGLHSEGSKSPARVIKENLSSIGKVKVREMNDKWKTVFEKEVALKKRMYALLSSE